MSCQIKQFANVADIPAVRGHLFPDDDDRGQYNFFFNNYFNILIFFKDLKIGCIIVSCLSLPRER